MAAAVTAAVLAAQPSATTAPDLSGVWKYSTLTPLQRPARYADQAFLSPAEGVAFEREERRKTDADRRGRTAAADVDGPGVNEFWMDRGPLAVIRGQRPTALIVDPPDGHLPALTSGADARRRALVAARSRFDGPEALSFSERCLRGADGPPILPDVDSSLIQIVQTSDHVVIAQEWSHQARVVPLDGRPHLPPSVKAWGGDARGTWAGETLVVDTTNFRMLDRFDEHLHLVERFTRLSSDALLYEFSVDDPTAYAAPWSVALPMRATDERLYESACHEGNYALTHMLRGARFQEREERSAP